MIKKLLTLLIGLMLLMPSALGGAPSAKPFVVFIKFNGGAVENLNVDFTCNGMTVTQVTNNLGGVLVNVGEYGHFKDVGGCSILEVDCGYDACRETFNVGDMDCPICEYTYELSEAPPMPEPECTADSDCAAGYECISEECSLIPEEPEPEPIVEDKVTSNADGTIALVESNFGECIDVVITDNDLAKLFDGVTDFNTEEYDAHEEILVKLCSETSIDDADFELEPRILLEEGGIEYRRVFDDAILYSEVADDEELEISFLGEDYEIISLSSSRMTIRHGEIYDDTDGCIQGKEILYDGFPLRIISVNENSIYVSYNGESKQIYRKELEEIGGIQVYVDEAIENEDGDDLCVIRIAEDIEEVIKDGDEYVEGWDYSVTEDYLGIRTNEEYRFLDEEYKPLKLGDKITLPNDFAIVKFNKISTSDETEIDIRIRDGYLNVKGSREDGNEDAFTYNNQDYDELYVGAEGILDKDKELITTDKVRIGESDVYLEKGSIIIGDLTIELGFTDILFKGVSYATKEDDYLAYSGISFRNPEDSVVSESIFDLIVPDEVPEITITIGAESKTEGLPDEPVGCDKPVVTTCTEEDCKETVCDPQPCTAVPCTAVPCSSETDCPEVPEGLTSGQIIIFITSLLGIGGIGTYAGMKLTGDRISKIKNVTYRVRVERDGDIVEEHRHAGIRSFHGINVTHREEHERHPKGERYPLFEKDDTGVYKYIR